MVTANIKPPAKGGGDSLIGTLLEGRYRIDEQLGEGGVGVVYRGTHLRLDRSVAIKVLQREYGASAPLLARFEREAKALAALSHPHIVPISDYGVQDGMPYLVMELLGGSILGDVLDEGPLEPTRAFDVTTQMLRALAFAHGEGLAHRDMKPDNVFLQDLRDGRDHVRILDFGLAKFVVTADPRDGPQVTVAGVAFGTPSYMSPEQATGQPSDERSDVYAVGIVMFEMLTGRRPFEGELSELLQQHIFTPPPKLADVCPDLGASEALEAFLAKALAKVPGERFQDAGEMRTAFEALPRPLLAGSSPAGGDSRQPDPYGATAFVKGEQQAAPSKPSKPADDAASRARKLRLAKRGAVAATLVLSALVVLCIAKGGGDDEPEAPGALVGPAGQTPSGAAPTGQPLARPASGQAAAQATMPPDPWRSRPVTSELARIKSRLDAGARIGEGTDKAIYGLARASADDPLPFLLLGRIYVARGWRSDGLERYEQAYARDPAARGDPKMLADLVDMASHRRLGRRATRALEEMYGAAALPAVDSALASGELSKNQVARLRSVRQSLARQSSGR